MLLISDNVQKNPRSGELQEIWRETRTSYLVLLVMSDQKEMV